MSIQCGVCSRELCVGGAHLNQDYCPGHKYPEVLARAKEIYQEDRETRLMAKNAAIVECRGYIAWPRLRDIIEFARLMKYRKLAIAFCHELAKEARKVTQILQEHGFEVISVTCRVGLKSSLSSPSGETSGDTLNSQPVTHGNPVAQAWLINEENPDLIILIGLCVGVDALLTKQTKAPKTTLIVKDRLTGHNPAVSIYTKKV
jgi:uncharacterized metal-binding protein